MPTSTVRPPQPGTGPIAVPPIDPPGLCQRWCDFWHAALSKPDRKAQEVGLGGERLVANVRLGLIAVLLAISLIALALYPRSEETWVTTLNTLVALGMALMVKQRARRTPVPAWLPFLSSSMDVTFVSTAMLGSMLVVHPLSAPNSFVIYPIYFLVIWAAALRNDARVCLLSGTLAIGQNLLLALLSLTQLAEAPVSGYWGRFDWMTQVDRLVYLGAATLLSIGTVLRSRALLQRSTRDGLTGLYNRACFDALLARELVITRRRRTPFTVALADIDFFKRLNDRHGHHEGDRALQWISRLLASSFRESDVVCRYGGEEFAVLLPGTRSVDGVRRLDRVRRAVAASPVPLSDGREDGVELTLSIGVASWPEDGDRIEELLEAADRRLYAAKRAGRNRLVNATLTPVPRRGPFARGARGVEESPAPPTAGSLAS